MKNSYGEVNIMTKAIDTLTLKSMLDANLPITLIDARGPSDEKIPSAKFLTGKSTVTEIQAAVPTKNSLVVTYCANIKCPASDKMASHLEDLGYKNVLEYPGGIHSWIAAGLNVESPAKERFVTMHGSPLHLSGKELNIGDAAVDVTLAGNDLQPVKLSDFDGKIIILATVPSLDTPVCDLETRTFNKKATNLSSDIKILVVSMDLPFAQKRWCGAGGIKNVITLSDYATGNLGQAYGVLIEELQLLARTIFIINQKGVITYRQIVTEIADEPDYNEVLEAVNSLLSTA
jgi:thioredoxin-dependent peroxiredoxin